MSFKSHNTSDTRKHAFNVQLATAYGVDVALLLEHLAFWAEKNLANNKHIHDGLVWCYDTFEALCDYFPYYGTKRRIERIIAAAIHFGLVTKGNYNKQKYDRTTWYALTERGLSLFPHLMQEKYLKRLKPASPLIAPNGAMDRTKRCHLYQILIQILITYVWGLTPHTQKQ